MIRRFDDWMLSLFQVASDFIHQWTGWDCIIQARIIRGFLAVAWLVEIVMEVEKHKYFDWWGGLCLLGALLRTFWESDRDEAARQAAASGFRNPRRVDTFEVYCRVAFLGLAVLAILTDLFIPANLLLWIFLLMALAQELEACDVQEPRAGRIREALGILGASLRLRVVPVPR